MNPTDRKTVLLVTPFFAPQSHAAVFRVHKLAKYLCEYGWKPIVLTVDRNYNYNEDPNLIEELPKEVEIHRVKYVEPSLRGLRMWLGGKDRSYLQIKKSARTHLSMDSIKKKGIVEKIYHYLLAHWLWVPDPYWTWCRPAIRKGLDLIRKNNIRVIYTTCLPYTCNVIGNELKQKSDCAWVADFRDPATYSQTTCSQIDEVFMLQREIERMTHRNADVVTGLAASYRNIFYDLYRSNKTVFIPTGVDEKLFESQASVEALDSPYILFCGEYLKEYGDHFFKILSQVLARPEIKSTGLKFLIVGHEEINRLWTEESIEKFNLNNSVMFRDHVSQSVLYQYIKGAKAVVLIPGRTAFWWANFAKMVDFIGLKKSVIAMVPDPSEARSELTKCGLGIFLDGDQSAQIETLVRFFTVDQDKSKINDKECERYWASAMTKSFVEIFEKLV
ncbi:MAG: hypothetical protein SGJ18_04445 [Pseudomonadota bacterium]|nr:hypothetical protein [Pseudomonadota bacterium]